MTIQSSDIEVPIKFSAKMKGQSDVTISPQVSGQLMKIYVSEGQQVRKGQTLFAIDSRNAQHVQRSPRHYRPVHRPGWSYPINYYEMIS